MGRPTKKTFTFAFKPKRSGYTVFATKSYYPKDKPYRSRRSSGIGTTLLSLFIKDVVQGLRGTKKR